MLLLQTQSVTGKKYRALINFANATCNSMSITVCREKTKSVYAKAYQSCLDSVVFKTNVYTHPDTGACFDDCELVYLKCGEDIKALLFSADCVCDWNGIALPYEPCFYRENVLWLKYISHEGLLIIERETAEDIEFLKSNGFVFSKTI